MASEFEIIARYFSFSKESTCGDATTELSRVNDPESAATNGVIVGVGDDAALLKLGRENLLVATDTLVSDVHFPANTPPACIASRALGVNLSDFAAMGAVPRWITLALTIPDNDEQWLDAFSASLAGGCERYSLALIGGDTTRGPLTITLTVLGSPVNSHHQAKSALASRTRCLYRSGAGVGDDVWVSGSLGKGAAALRVLTQGRNPRGGWRIDDAQAEDLRASFYSPKPQLLLGQSLVNMASAAIDISDGLLADAGHIARSSGVTLALQGEALPAHPALAGLTDRKLARLWALAGGDDYELLFTANASRRDDVNALARRIGVQCTLVGEVTKRSKDGSSADELVTLDGEGWAKPALAGFEHF